MENPYQSETGCCPRFNPEPWQDKEINWQDKLFVKDRIRSIFHIPINFGKVMVRTMQKVGAAGAHSPEPFLMTDENSLWGADLYVEVAKEVPDAENVRISGNFLTRVYEGPYKDMRKWVEDMKAYVQSRGKEMKKMYYFYTTCPRCAKHYGKNYTVLLAQV